ncbi:MaoC family dehydratase [Pseudomonas sp. NFACC45]|uniref:MaoC family dehydratase n=1 Tax=Pseudomonas sp. NFACC45 TaxID=1566201 RepID=UPI0008E8835A|nr:MaoC family dehydratase [Pseudomonas sp. NFACC45]SFG91136.1 Acyl dehydratase [Pseudomonas sp. NFACC45]
MSETNAAEFPTHKFVTHRRTITETDIVNFVNLTGFHEPYFIDMEYLKANMSGAHQNRFAPGPMIISYSMGLVSPILMKVVADVLEGHAVGNFAGMTGLQARIHSAAFPGDTLHVEGEAKIKAISSSGFTILDLLHVTKNQRGEKVVEFTETVLFHRPGTTE